MMNDIFFDPKMVAFHDFPRNPPKPMKNKGKLSKTNVFPLFSLILTKNHQMAPSSDRKKIYYPSSKKNNFLSVKWNTLKTSFLKCLRVCNFFFSQRCWCSQHLKKYHFWILCENRLLNFRSQLSGNAKNIQNQGWFWQHFL